MTDLNLRPAYTINDVIQSQVELLNNSLANANLDDRENVHKILSHLDGICEILYGKLNLLDQVDDFNQHIQEIGRAQHPRLSSSKRSKSIREAAKVESNTPSVIELQSVPEGSAVPVANTGEKTIEEKVADPTEFHKLTIGDLADKPKYDKSKPINSNLLKSSVEGIKGKWSSFNGTATVTIVGDRNKFPDTYELKSARYLNEDLVVSGDANFTIDDITLHIEEKGVEFDIADLELTILDLVSRETIEIKFS